MGRSTDVEMQHAVDRIVRFENMLFNEGVLILKFWFHLSREQQKKRLKELEKDPATRWRVTKLDWERFKIYDRFRKISEHALRETSTGNAPWVVVEGADPRYRSLTVGKVLLKLMKKRLADKDGPKVRSQAAPLVPVMDNLKLVRDLDMTQKIPKPQYEKKLEKYQGSLNLLSRSKKFKERSLILVFEDRMRRARAAPCGASPARWTRGSTPSRR